ncbi:hypothetical protein BH09ACT6_BH09ACT6_14440 [soil metagenome]
MNRRILTILAAVTLTTLALGGCSALGNSASTANSGSSGSSGSSGPSGSSGSSGGGIAAPQPAPDGTTSGSAAVGGSATSTLPDTQVVTTGSISLTGDDPIAIADKAVALVEAAGGHVDNRSESTGDSGQPGIITPLGGSTPSMTSPDKTGTAGSSPGSARADLTLRIPSAQVTATVDALKKLGTVDSVSLTATDVTTQVADMNARITALQASVDRLLALMSKATTTTDLIAIETALSQRQAELDGLKAQRDSLKDQIQYASISLAITRHNALAAGAPSDFWGGLAVGSASVVAGVAGSLVVLGMALPWLLLLAIAAAVVLLIVWLVTRRSRKA